MKRKLLCLFAFLPFLSFGQILNEDFEGTTFPPTGWTVTQTNANETWGSFAVAGFSGTKAAAVAYDVANQDETLTSPSVSLTGQASAYLTFKIGMSYYWGVDPNDNYDVTVKVSTDGGTTWTDVWSEADLIADTDFATNQVPYTPYDVTVDISTIAGNAADVKVAFNYAGADGAQLIIDKVVITTEEPEVPEPTFPFPYCAITGFATVEPITSVEFAGISNTTSAEVNGTPNLEDFTQVVGLVDAAGIYPITLKGNADGDFENFYTVYFDWNHNNLLTDEGESYEIGSATGSTGEDDIVVAGDIVVPATALAGDTRMRVVKKYNSYATGPCVPTSIYGQAEDYTVSVTALATNSFNASQFAYYPNPVKNTLNLSYNKNISDVKVLNLLGQEVIVRSINATQGQVDMSNLSTGTYIVKVTADNAVQTIKVVKQ